MACLPLWRSAIQISLTTENFSAKRGLGECEDHRVEGKLVEGITNGHVILSICNMKMRSNIVCVLIMLYWVNMVQASFNSCLSSGIHL